MQRIRITYARSFALRYTGHLDMQLVWERTLRRARLPLAYSQGFHPQPRINQACPLPLGMTSRMEMLDFWLDPEFVIAELIQVLSPVLPPGINLISCAEVDLHLPSLQSQVNAASFLCTFLIPFDSSQLIKNVADMMAASDLPRVRRDKPYDLRPLIFSLDILQSSDPTLPHLSMHLSAREGATGRPEEVISELGFDPLDVRYERFALHFSTNA